MERKTLFDLMNDHAREIVGYNNCIVNLKQAFIKGMAAGIDKEILGKTNNTIKNYENLVRLLREHIKYMRYFKRINRETLLTINAHINLYSNNVNEIISLLN